MANMAQCLSVKASVFFGNNGSKNFFNARVWEAASDNFL